MKKIKSKYLILNQILFYLVLWTILFLIWYWTKKGVSNIYLQDALMGSSMIVFGICLLHGVIKLAFKKMSKKLNSFIGIVVILVLMLIIFITSFYI